MEERKKGGVGLERREREWNSKRRARRTGMNFG